MIGFTQPQCSSCKWLRFTTWDKPPDCTAFPGKIPQDIWLNVADHRKPYPGDHGIRWAPDKPTTKFPEESLIKNGSK